MPAKVRNFKTEMNYFWTINEWTLGKYIWKVLIIQFNFNTIGYPSQRKKYTQKNN